MLNILFALALAAAPPDTTYSAAHLAAELPALIAVDSSKYGFSVEFDTVSASSRGTGLGALARANHHYLLYLTMHTPGGIMRPGVMVGSRAEIHDRVVRDLRADSAYVRIVSESVRRMRDTAGTRAEPRTSVKFDRVMDIASRFFYPDAILETGYIQSHVCVGINGIVDMQGGRDLATEAFVYAAIFHDILAPRFYVDADFNEASRLINAMDLSTDREARLRRAQGVMWALMLRSEKLRQVVRYDYAKTAAYLPFRITDVPASSREAAR